MGGVTALTALLVSCWENTRDGNYQPKLNANVMFIHTSFDELAFDKPDLFREFVMRQPHSILDYGFYAAATNHLPHATGYRGEGFREFPDGLDPWEIPFWINVALIRTTNDNVGHKIQIFEIKFWSSGPNKRNEQGSGDDILFGPFETQVR